MCQRLYLLRQIDHQRAEGMGRIDGQQFAIDTHESSLHRQKTHQRTQKGGLPRAFRPCDTGDLSVPRDQRQSFDERFPSNGDGGILDL